LNRIALTALVVAYVLLVAWVFWELPAYQDAMHMGPHGGWGP